MYKSHETREGTRLVPVLSKDPACYASRGVFKLNLATQGRIEKAPSKLLKVKVWWSPFWCWGGTGHCRFLRAGFFVSRIPAWFQ